MSIPGTTRPPARSHAVAMRVGQGPGQRHGRGGVARERADHGVGVAQLRERPVERHGQERDAQLVGERRELPPLPRAAGRDDDLARAHAGRRDDG
jgi:hypothetical protein